MGNVIMKIVDNSVSVTSQEGQLLSQRTGYFIFLLFLIITCLTGCSRTSSPERGVVIEQVDKNSGAEKTGLLAGDIVVGWSRGNVGGSISSPFDLAEIEIEENPRGTVVLEGLRDYHRKSWTLGRTEWGIGCRPVLTESLLLAYQESKKLAQKSEWAKATERLQTLAGHVKQSDLVWLRPWLLSRAAEWLAKSKDWAKVDAIYSEALDGASIAGPKVTSHILGVWGDLFGTRTDREDSAKAEQCYKRSLAELQRVASTSLSLAAIYNRLGHVLLDRGDPEQAAEFYGKALALREQLAPNSLAVAGSLNNLGNVALDRSAFREAEKFYRNALTIKQDLAPGTLDVAISLNNLGIAVVDQGDLTEGEQYNR